MKTAKKVIAAVDLLCPECGETIPAPGGSLFWTVDELPVTGSVIACPSCGRNCRAPKVK